MKKTLKVGYGQKAEKVTIESTCKKLYGTAVWKELGKDVFYYVERSRHLGRTIEAAHRYDLTKEEFEAL
jgi:hypothetical protein